jgi:SAM-dependent methyltransferase
MVNKIKRFLIKEQFDPSIAGFFINPFYFGRKSIYNKIKGYANQVQGKTLDIGCGDKPYQNLFKQVTSYIGMDIEISGHNNTMKKADIYYDGLNFPFDEKCFDSAICFEVLEHVFNPIQFINEIKRVLKDGGLLLITIPFVWDEHEKPYDFARYTSYGLKHLFESQGFEIIEHSKYLNDFRLIFLLINNYIYKIFKKILPSTFAWIFILIFSIPSNIMGLISLIIPKNEDFYFGNIFILKKIS